MPRYVGAPTNVGCLGNRATWGNSDTALKKRDLSGGTVVKLQEGSNPEARVMPSQPDRRRGNSRRLTLYLPVFGREVWLVV